MRNCIIIFFCMSLVVINEGYCASIGDPIEALGSNKISISAEQNLVFSREIEYGSFKQADIKDAYQWYGKASYGIGDYLTYMPRLVYLTLNINLGILVVMVLISNMTLVPCGVLEF